MNNTWMTVDPYMRGRMNDVKSYAPPFQLGEALQGGAIGVVADVQRPVAQGRRSGAELLRLARGVQRPGRRGAEAGHPRPAAAGLPRLRRHAGPDRLCRPAADRRDEGRRRGVRLRRGRRGGLGRLPDRQAEGPHRDRLGRRRREGRVPEGDRRRPRDRLQGRARPDRRPDARRARTASTSISRTSAARTWRRR